MFPSLIGIIYGLGLFISALPHFTTEPLDPASVIFGSNQFSSSIASDGNGLCNTATNDTTLNSTDTNVCTDGDEGVLRPLSWLIIGRLVTGAGYACIIPFLFSYLDDGVSKETLSTYTSE